MALYKDLFHKTHDKSLKTLSCKGRKALLRIPVQCSILKAASKRRVSFSFFGMEAGYFLVFE